MPLTASLQYGSSEPISVTFGLTIARSKAMTLRYARRHNLVSEGMSETQIAQAVIRHIFKEVAADSEDTQLHELVEAQMATINATVKTDNTLDP